MASNDNNKTGEAVVILHGIARTKTNMRVVESRMKKAGYDAYSFSYPSLTLDIAALSQWLSCKLEEENIWQNHTKVHFVTHSMGGLVAGGYLDKAQESLDKDQMGRVVMLGVPYGGSEYADALQDYGFYQRGFGPAGQQLTTDFRKAAAFTPWYDLGVIAGTSNWCYPSGRFFIDGDHDGRVSVESTKIPQMKDHLAMKAQHWTMVYQPSVLDQVEHFLADGQFKKDTGLKPT